MRDHLGELGDARVVPVSFARRELVLDHVAFFGWPWPFAVDPARRLYRAFGLGHGSRWNVFGPRAILNDLRLRWKGSAMGPSRQRDLTQLGGDFVLDARGEFLFERPQRGPDDRPAVAELVEAVRRARR